MRHESNCRCGLKEIDFHRPKFICIAGENGAVKSARGGCGRREGAAYYNCPVDILDFSLGLAMAGISKDEVRSVAELRTTFRLLTQPLSDAAAMFPKHGRPMVLIMDSVDRLAKGAIFVLELRLVCPAIS
jgi:hypothetical protein